MCASVSVCVSACITHFLGVKIAQQRFLHAHVHVDVVALGHQLHPGGEGEVDKGKR